MLLTTQGTNIKELVRPVKLALYFLTRSTVLTRKELAACTGLASVGGRQEGTHVRTHEGYVVQIQLTQRVKGLYFLKRGKAKHRRILGRSRWGVVRSRRWGKHRNCGGMTHGKIIRLRAMLRRREHMSGQRMTPGVVTKRRMVNRSVVSGWSMPRSRSKRRLSRNRCRRSWWGSKSSKCGRNMILNSQALCGKSHIHGFLLVVPVVLY
jgi:hypothetical protein